jgi:hypothetical protein
MTDIVDRLRFTPGTSMAGTPLNIPNDDPLYLEAADEIEQLRKACDEWSEVSQRNFQRAKTAETERDRMRAALKPFAMAADKITDPHSIVFDGGAMRSDCVFAEDFYAARAALAQEPS